MGDAARYVDEGALASAPTGPAAAPNATPGAPAIPAVALAVARTSPVAVAASESVLVERAVERAALSLLPPADHALASEFRNCRLVWRHQMLPCENRAVITGGRLRDCSVSTHGVSIENSTFGV